MLKLVLGALLCACAAVPAIAVANCDSPSAALAGPGVQSVYENAGIYEWNEGLQAWVLVEAAYVPFFETETLRPGDEYIAPEVLWGAEGGGSGGGYLVQGGGTQPRRGQGRGGAGQPGIACAESPKELPPVVVTGSRPSFGRLIALFWRGQLLNAGRGPGAVRRSLHAVTADQSVTCASSEDDRRGAALDAIKRLGYLASGTIIRVNYGSGHFQVWVVRAPTFTDRGLESVGGCVGG